MKRLDPKIIRIGDTVEIVKPEFFVRCGYALTIADMEPLAEADIMTRLCGLLREKGYSIRTSFHGETREYSMLKHAVAKAMLASKKWGGPIRSIFTDLRPGQLGERFEVIGKFVKQTGSYEPGCDSVDPEDGGYPPYLRMAKSHVILELAYIEESDYIQQIETINIEAANVRKV